MCKKSNRVNKSINIRLLNANMQVELSEHIISVLYVNID